MTQGIITRYNRLNGRKASMQAVFLCPPKVPCRIKDPNRLKGASLYIGHSNLNHGGKDMVTQTRNKGQELCSELMEVDTLVRDYKRRQAQEDAAKYRAKVHADRVRLGLEVSNA